MKHRESVQFYLNGVRHDVVPESPAQTLLQYLREHQRLTGTKEGCAEGDCGACTVTLASLSPDGTAVLYRAINACIRFLPTLDGMALWTVEALAPGPDRLHPVQQALVDHHGSQCGFCTPGFVMSLYTMYRNGRRAAPREEILDNLSGNLCRCTGYRPIIEAARHLDAYPHDNHDDESVRRQLLELREELAGQGMLRVQAGGQLLLAPTTADELAQACEAHPDAVILAGGTDVGLWVTKQLRTLGTIIYLGNVTSLGSIEPHSDHLRIGAAVSLNDGWDAVARDYPEATELWKRFASMPIRNSGTLVGNLANGSPIGDTAPLFMALDARLVLRKGARAREVALDDFYLDYRKQDREPGEFVEAVLLPRRHPATQIASYKVSRRFDQDISAVCSAYALELDEAGIVQSIRIAHGGMAATTRRARVAEQALAGKPWAHETVQQAMQAMAGDYQPMTDMRASSDYRLSVAQNLLYRFFLESTGAAATRV